MPAGLILALLSPFGVTKAHATNTTGGDVLWTLDGGPNAYRSMIKSVRYQARQQQIYGSGPTQVWTTRPTDTGNVSNNYFTLRLGTTQSLTDAFLVIRRHDLYVQVFYQPSTRAYRYFSDAAHRARPFRARGTSSTTPTSVS
ncbi:hypothetical protein [Streptomyces sp. NPDC096311]|uniref:hypothetical protein n=1 Tax=Streptomyces sp. NPDC096311 TaxID=3366083 RepID=UPI00381DB7CC